MPFTVEETLKASDLPADVIPHMIWNEVLLGVRKRQVYEEAFQVTEMLVGAYGTKISVPILSTRFTAGTISEDNLDTSGYTVSDPAVTDVDVSIGNQVYVAARLSDVLREDQPKYNWVAIILQDMGRAVTVYRDAALRDVLEAGAGNVQAAATFGALDHDDILDCLGLMKADSWFPDDGTPFLFIHPDQETDLLKDTRFYDTKRYSMGQLPMQDQEPLYAGTRVRVTDNATTAIALVASPPTHRFGPAAITAWKRRLTVKSDREERFGRELWITSMRYGSSVVQANGVGLITGC